MSKEYVEPIVTDNKGNVYISIKTANEYMDKYMKALEEVNKFIDDHEYYLQDGNDMFVVFKSKELKDIVNKALGDDK